jgi:protein-disulfide isomerase-like protein with CxxC motif
MNLQDLIDQYTAKMHQVDELADEKRLAERKLQLATDDKKAIRHEIAEFFKKAGGKGVHTFLLEVNGKQTVCQISLDCHPEHDNFLTFAEITPIEELVILEEELVL